MFRVEKLHIEIGATTVYVTHAQLEAMSLADRIAVMDGGEILQADEPSIIYNKPKTKFVASFIGSPGMNFIDINQGISNEQSSISIENVSFNIPKQLEISNCELLKQTEGELGYPSATRVFKVNANEKSDFIAKGGKVLKTF